MEGAGNSVPCRGLGIGVTHPLCGIQRDGNRKSQGALARLCEFPGSAAQGNPIVPQIAKQLKKQESGSEAKPDSEKAALNSVLRMLRMLHMPAGRLWEPPCGGMGYAPALQAGERAPLGLRGLGEDFDFSP